MFPLPTDGTALAQEAIRRKNEKDQQAAATPPPTLAPQPDVQTPAPALTTLPAPSKVKGIGPLPGSPQAANAERLQTLQQSPSGIGGIHNPYARHALQVLDAVGSAFFPAIATGIPGTQLHHNMLVGQARNAVAGDQASQAAQDEQALREAQTAHTQAQTNELENPAPLQDTFKALPTATGYGSFNEKKGTLEPLKMGNEIAQPVEKPEKTPPQNVHVLPDGKVISVHTDENGKSTAEVVYQGDPKIQTGVRPLEINGEEHTVLYNSQTGEPIKDLGKTGVKPPVINVNANAGREFQEKERGRGLLDKAESEYRTAASSADELSGFIDAARAGNKVAAAASPLEGTLSIVTSQGVKRINRTEVEGIGGAGSLFDKLMGEVGKIGAGQPIPANIQEDFKKLSSLLKQNAYSKYREAHKSAVKRYNLQDEEPLPEPINPKPSTPSGPPTISTKADYDKLPSGALYIKMVNGVPQTLRKK